jgi:hypothetical protein
VDVLILGVFVSISIEKSNFIKNRL